MSYFFLAVSAVIPSLLLMLYFHRRDVFPEPPRVLWTTFGLGVLSVIPVLMVGIPILMLVNFFPTILSRSLGLAFLGAAIPEELFKFLVLWFFAARHEAFDEPMDGIVYGVAASLGFATLENILYVTSYGIGVGIVRAIMAVPAHAFMGAIMGYFVGQAICTDGSRRGLLFRALAWPMLIHGLYDFPLMTVKAGVASGPAVPHWVLALVPLSLLILIIIWVWSLRLVRGLRQEQLTQGEIPRPGLRRPRSGRAFAWFLVAGGGLSAAAGGLFSFGVVLALLFGETVPEPLSNLIVGWIIVGLAPLVVGTLLFARGVGKLNHSADAARGEIAGGTSFEAVSSSKAAGRP